MDVGVDQYLVDLQLVGNILQISYIFLFEFLGESFIFRFHRCENDKDLLHPFRFLIFLDILCELGLFFGFVLHEIRMDK